MTGSVEQVLQPSISVVICTYQRADLLPKAIKSLLSQTLEASEFETIVVDNDSQDQTEQSVREYARKHPHMRYVHHSTPGRHSPGVPDAGMYPDLSSLPDKLILLGALSESALPR